MKYSGLSHSGSVQDMILSAALKRYKAVIYVLFHYSSFPILPLPLHLPLPQWIHKASGKSGEREVSCFTHIAPQNSSWEQWEIKCWLFCWLCIKQQENRLFAMEFTPGSQDTKINITQQNRKNGRALNKKARMQLCALNGIVTVQQQQEACVPKASLVLVTCTLHGMDTGEGRLSVKM